VVSGVRAVSGKSSKGNEPKVPLTIYRFVVFLFFNEKGSTTVMLCRSAKCKSK
jgi:hypothetical protein